MKASSRNFSLFILCAVAALFSTFGDQAFAQNTFSPTLTGSVSANPDINSPSSTTHSATIPDDNPAIANHADTFGTALARADFSLSEFDDALYFDFSSDVSASSSANTKPRALVAMTLFFTASAPVHLSLIAEAHAPSGSRSSAHVFLNNAVSGALIFEIGSQSIGLTETGTFNDWIPQGRYVLNVDSIATLDPNISETNGAANFNGTLIIVPEPCSALYLIVGAFLCLRRRTLRTNERIA